VFHYQNEIARYSLRLHQRNIRTTHIAHAADKSKYFEELSTNPYVRTKMWDPGPSRAPLHPVKIRDIDILISGNQSPEVYPFRHRLSELARTYFTRRNWKVFEAPHPGYELPPREGSFVGREYVILLNRSRIALTCTSKYNYALSRYYEMALCGVAIATDLPDQEEDRKIFQKTMINVFPWETDETIARRIEEILYDEGRRARMAADCRDHVNLLRTTDRYANQFLYICQEISHEFKNR